MYPLMVAKRLRCFAVIVAIAVVTAACGDDSAGGAVSTEAFCAELEAIDANGELDLEDPEALAEFRDLADRAPSEVRGAMEEFGRIVADLEGIEGEDEAAFEALFALFGDRDFLQALKDISLFMADECGLEVNDIDQIRDLDPDDPSSLFGDFGLESGAGSNDDPGLGLDGPSDDSTIENDFGGSGDEPSNLDQLEDHLETNYSDASWVSEIVGQSLRTEGNQVVLTLSFAGVEVADALAACEATAEWSSGHFDSSTEVTIEVWDGESELAVSVDGALCGQP